MPQPEATQTPVQTVPVSKLAQQVADAATGQGAKDLAQQLVDAEDAATVIALADEAGYAVSYT